MSEHHIYARWVFGPNVKTEKDHPHLCNDVTKNLCRDCHDEMEEINRELEAMILRPFQFCFRKTYDLFMQKKEVTTADIFAIAMVGFVKIFTRGFKFCATDNNAWLSKRMQTPGIALRKKKKNGQ